MAADNETGRYNMMFFGSAKITEATVQSNVLIPLDKVQESVKTLQNIRPSKSVDNALDIIASSYERIEKISMNKQEESITEAPKTPLSSKL